MTWGKAKLKVLLERQGIKIGTTTIQRVINENKLFLPRGQRMFKKRRLNTKPSPPEELKEAFSGSLVQIDVKHLTTPWGKRYYKLSATDTGTRMVFKKALFIGCSITGLAGGHTGALKRTLALSPR